VFSDTYHIQSTTSQQLRIFAKMLFLISSVLKNAQNVGFVFQTWTL